MKKISPTFTYLIFSVLVMVILVTSYVYFLSSLSKIKNERLAIVTELKAEVEGEVSRGSERIREYFVIAGEEALFVSYLEEECLRFGIICETQSLEESTPNEKLSSLQVFKVNLKSSGEFASTMNFLEAIEQSKYPITISEVNLNYVSVWEGTYMFSVPVVPR